MKTLNLPNEEKYQAILRTTISGFYLIDLQGHILDVNNSFCRITGYSREELLKMSINNLKILENPAVIAQHIRKIIKNGRGHFELQQRHKDGRILDLDISASYIKLKEGNRIFAFFKDITEQKLAKKEIVRLNAELEKRVARRTRQLKVANLKLLKEITVRRKVEANLRKQQEELEKIINYSPAMIFYKDRENRFIRVNEAFARAMGMSRNTLEGASIFDIYPKEEADKYWKDDKTVIASGQPKRSIFEPLDTPAGRKWIMTDKVPYRNTTGKITGVIGFAIDVTERKKYEEELASSLTEKELLLKEINHRVKNNLQTLSSIFNLQLMSIKNEEAAAVLKSTQERVRSMALIHDLLYQSGNLNEIDFEEYVKVLILNLRNSYAAHFEELEITIDAGGIRLDIGTALPCGLIVNELFSNSLKHAFQDKKNKKIWLKFESDKRNNAYKLVIGDNGRGLKDGFDIEKANTLGLQLVAGLTRQLNGSIVLKGKNGTQFTIVFLKSKRGGG